MGLPWPLGEFLWNTVLCWCMPGLVRLHLSIPLLQPPSGEGEQFLLPSNANVIEEVI